MRIVNDHLAVKATMIPPHANGYVLLAAEVGRWRGPLIRTGAAKRRLLARLATQCAQLTARPDVVEAVTFRGVLIANRSGDDLVTDRDVHHARYDVVVLIRMTDPQAATAIRQDPAYEKLAHTLRSHARYVHEVVARNAVRLGEVDHAPDHVYLFNFFYADDNEHLVPVFEYTAGWFQAKTALPNSTLLEPLPGESADNGIINHASWPNFRAFLPSLLFRPTFRRFVLANFAANNIAAQPILYRRELAKTLSPGRSAESNVTRAS